METMTWLETIELLGLDLQVTLVLALLGLDAFERALHSAWNAWRTAATAGSPPERIAVGWARHV